ncbi:DNA-directed RNA polymerase subunit B [Candidatus Woesearchaeota archaeon]|nr:DNA-directed RNA polymerase subunit B [Candidatus Woesearchaeota archaeon]
MIDVFIDERYAGKVENAEEFIKLVKEERRKGKLPPELNISFSKRYNEINVEISRGRARRPLIIVEDGKSRLTPDIINQVEENKLTWKDLVNKGIIEYLDALEEESSLVALYEKDLTKDHSHLEISPSMILGLTTSLVPYSNFGQSSRLNRGSKTQKQALGLYISNYLLRMDTDVSVLQYPQRPIVHTITQDIFNVNKHPAGQNVIIAIMSYQGYNMQDSLVINKGSVQRGLGRSFYFRPYGAEELRYSGGLIDEIGIPDKEVKGYRSEKEYRLLEEDGIIYPEAEIKTGFLGELEDFSIAASTRRESSVTVKHGEAGVVDMVVLTENEEGNKLVQIRARDLRIPEIGDKFASRHGQKGVIGLLVPHADMPFTISGITPDLIFSPHSIPSRMTISHLIEIIGGKAGALSGQYINGTIFESQSEKELRSFLKELGFRENGTERMYNGISGEEFKVDIFVGNMYYLKLKHMVANKLHARASGRIQLLTRQPIEGRSKGGGLRLGEMEKDCFVAHGASLLLKERFDSDKTIVSVCESCGLLAVNDPYRNRKFCTHCGSNVTITPIELSYAFKLLLDELKSLCIYPKIKLVSKY